MQRAILVLALAGSLVAGNAVARQQVCNYAAGETLLVGPYTSEVLSDCHWYLLGDCRLRTTTQLYACADANGHVTNSGVLTVSTKGWYGPVQQ